MKIAATFYCRADRKDCVGPVFEQAAKMGQWLNNRGFTVLIEKTKDKNEFEVYYGDELGLHKPIRIAFQSDDIYPSVIWPAGSGDLLMKFLSGRTSTDMKPSRYSIVVSFTGEFWLWTVFDDTVNPPGMILFQPPGSTGFKTAEEALAAAQKRTDAS